MHVRDSCTCNEVWFHLQSQNSAQFKNIFYNLNNQKSFLSTKHIWSKLKNISYGYIKCRVFKSHEKHVHHMLLCTLISYMLLSAYFWSIFHCKNKKKDYSLQLFATAFTLNKDYKTTRSWEMGYRGE